MTYNIPKEIKTDVKISKFIYKNDLLLCVFYVSTVFFLSSFVANKYIMYYYIFYIMVLVYLLLPSQDNVGKKNYYSLAKVFISDKNSYKFGNGLEEIRD